MVDSHMWLGRSKNGKVHRGRVESRLSRVR